MDVARDAVGVGPEADVDLLGVEGPRHRRGSAPQERADLRRLVLVEVGDVKDVALRLDDQRPDAERADAVLDHPARGLVDPPARTWPAAGGQVAGEATRVVGGLDHARNRAASQVSMSSVAAAAIAIGKPRKPWPHSG